MNPREKTDPKIIPTAARPDKKKLIQRVALRPDPPMAELRGNPGRCRFLQGLQKFADIPPAFIF
jgi:hypothetical protein